MRGKCGKGKGKGERERERPMEGKVVKTWGRQGSSFARGVLLGKRIFLEFAYWVLYFWRTFLVFLKTIFTVSSHFPREINTKI